MDDLIAFLRARLDEREAHIADLRARSGEDQGLSGPWKPEGPDFALADIESKRQMLAMHSHPYCGWCADGGKEGDGGRPCYHLALLALPYAGHEDYREGWKP